MRIIIKPKGAVILAAMIVVLSLCAFRRFVPSSAANATSSPSSSSPGMAIYRDGMENGWEGPGWSWAKDVDYNSRQMPHTGSCSIRARFGAWEGLKFTHPAPLNHDAMARFSFFIKAGGKGGQRLRVTVANGGKSLGQPVGLDPLPSGVWVAVTIPMSLFNGADLNKVQEFWIQDMTGQENDPVFIDDINVLPANTPDPQGEATVSLKTVAN